MLVVSAIFVGDGGQQIDERGVRANPVKRHLYRDDFRIVNGRSDKGLCWAVGSQENLSALARSSRGD